MSDEQQRIADLQRMIDEMGLNNAQQQPEAAPDFAAMEKRIQDIRQAESQAKDLSSVPFVGGFGQTVKGNLENRVLGLGNSLMQGLDKLGINIPPNPYGIINTEGARQDVRDRSQAINDLNAAVAEESPYGSFAGNALTFVAEAAIGGKGFTHSNPKIQFLGRTAQEAAVGGLYGLSTVAMSDEEKESAIAVGLLTGAIAPHAVGATMNLGGKAFRLSSDRLKRIALLTRMEKMFDQSGLLTAAEMLGHRGLAKIEAALDNIPFLGLGRKRDQQKEAFIEMAEGLIERFGAGRVPVRGSTDEARKELGSILFRQYHKNYDEVWKRYESVAARLDELPVHIQPKVKLVNMYKTANELLEMEMRLPKSGQNQELITLLKGYVDAPETMTWADATRLLRRVKEQAVVQMEKAAKKETTREYGAALNKMEAGLYADMREFANFAENHIYRKRIPGENLVQQLDGANDMFRRLVLPFYKSDVLTDITRGEDFAVDNVVSAFMTRTARVESRPYRPGRPGSKRPTGVEINSPLYGEAVPPEGVDIIRGLMMREALDKSLGGKWIIEPAKFADELSAMQKSWGITMTKEQQELLQGFVQLTNEGYRAFRKASDLGSIVVGLGAVGGAAAASQGGPEGLAPYLATIFGARFLLGTKGGTDLLKMAAHIDDFTTREGRHVLHVANIAMTRYLEMHYPEIHKELRGKYPAPPELAEAAQNMFAHPVQ